MSHSNGNFNMHVESLQSELSSSTRMSSICLRLWTLISFMVNVIVAYVAMFKTNIEMAQEYFIYVTPSPPFFKIWIVIYVTMLLVVLHNLYRNVWGAKSCQLFIVSNCLFIISSAIWHLRSIQFVAISGFVLASVDDTTIWFWRVLVDQHMEGQKQVEPQSYEQGTAVSIQSEENVQIRQGRKKNRYSPFQLLIVRNVISFYIGWITVAGTIETGLACVYWWGLSLCQQFIIFWITTPIAATALYLFLAMKLKDEYKYCFGYILSVIWGLIGAGIASVDNITKRNYC